MSGKIFSMHIKLRFLTSFEMTISELCEENRVGLRLNRKPTLFSSRLLRIPVILSEAKNLGFLIGHQ